ncbi:MAG: hypothetical protein HN976_16135 [Lentisphaerae bacterium]|nr:hypothetical protein [Lentisphaerota bacterium]
MARAHPSRYRDRDQNRFRNRPEKSKGYVNEQETDARIRGSPEEDRWTITATIRVDDWVSGFRHRVPQS